MFATLLMFAALRREFLIWSGFSLLSYDKSQMGMSRQSIVIQKPVDATELTGRPPY